MEYSNEINILQLVIDGLWVPDPSIVAGNLDDVLHKYKFLRKTYLWWTNDSLNMYNMNIGMFYLKRPTLVSEIDNWNVRVDLRYRSSIR